MEEINATRSKSDALLWVLVGVLVALGVFSTYYFNEIGAALIFTGWIVLVAVELGLIMLTSQGKKLWAFAKDAKIELYKVVWPTREETVKITMMIVAMVVIMSLILWGVDSILLRMVGWLMGR